MSEYAIEQLTAMPDDELSELVASEVMGWLYRIKGSSWRPTTDWAQAHLVIDEVSKKGVIARLRAGKNLAEQVRAADGVKSALTVMFHMTPRQVCIAAVLACAKGGGDGDG